MIYYPDRLLPKSINNLIIIYAANAAALNRQILISHVLWVGLVWTLVNTVAMRFLFMVNILLFVITATCHYTHE